MEFRKEEIVIAGGGLMGSSAAWQLAKSGKRVVLLEQQEQEYSNGSSFGEARICRSLGPKNDIWSWLHRRSVSETEQLISFLNKNDSVKHAMEDIYITSPVTYLFKTEKKQVIQRMLQQQNDNYRCAISQEEATDMFNVSISEEQVVIQEYRLHSGTINPGTLISKLHAAIRYKGGDIIYGQKIEEIKHENNGYHILTSNKTSGQQTNILARQMISASGPFNGQLLKGVAPEIAKLITPERVPLSFFSVNKNRYECYSPEQKQKIADFFPYIDLDSDNDHTFAMIEKMENRVPLLKIGGHFRREPIENIEEAWNMKINDSEIAWAKNQLHDYFRLLKIPLPSDGLVYEKGYSCIYSLTGNEVPIVDCIHPDLVLMGGFSGVGAKGSLAYGLIAANQLSETSEDGFMYQKVVNALKRVR